MKAQALIARRSIGTDGDTPSNRWRERDLMERYPQLLRSTGKAIIGAAVCVALSGCAYKPLNAPCAPDEGGQPLAYAESPTRPQPDVFRSFDRCGPMKPI